MTVHTVVQGEHLSGLADSNGFFSFKTLLAHPDNAGLQSGGANPHVLTPGTKVTIPDKQQKQISRQTDASHRFIVRTTPLKLLLEVSRQFGQSLAATPYKLKLDADVAGALGGKGDANTPVAKQLKTAEITVSETVPAGQAASTVLDTVVSLAVGSLDPIDTSDGQLARLINLGYYRGPFEPVDDYELASAVEEFQCDSSLPLTGVCDDATRAKLKTLNGC